MSRHPVRWTTLCLLLQTACAWGAARGRSDSPLGTNLEQSAQYSCWTFIDAFKFSAPWTSGGPGKWNDKRPIDTDDHGWVKSLQPGQVVRTALLAFPLPVRPAGKYVVLYDGKGEVNGKHALKYAGRARLVSSSPGRDVIDVPATGDAIRIFIQAVDPADHVRNIRVIMPGGIYAGDPYTTVYNPASGRTDYLPFEKCYSTLVFHPDFLRSLRPYGVVRFMNPMRINHSKMRTWEERPLPDDCRYSESSGSRVGWGKGWPLEHIIALANRLGFDPWVNIPHLADDGYIRSMAKMLKRDLRADLKPYVEWSNEVGNSQFSQCAYARAQGVARGLDANPAVAGHKYQVARSVEAFTIFEGVYRNRSRFLTALGPKGSKPAYVRAMLEHLISMNAADKIDYITIGGYFGFHYNWPNRARKVATLKPDELIDRILAEDLQNAFNQMRRMKGIIADLGLEIPICVYEGGQHLRQNTAKGNKALERKIKALFEAVNRHPRMKDVYLAFFNGYKDIVGGHVFCHYLDTSKWTFNSYFGAREHHQQTRAEAPKYDAIRTFIEKNRKWW